MGDEVVLSALVARATQIDLTWWRMRLEASLAALPDLESRRPS